MNTLLSFNLLKNTENEKKTITTQGELAEYILSQINGSGSEMPEEEKEQMSARIDAKLKAGKKLTPEEESYLQKNDPQMYLQYKRIRAMADELVAQLKHAKTKQKANEIITSAMAGIPKDDPCREQIIAAMNETAKEFKKLPAYNRLPENDADAKRKTGGTGEEVLNQTGDDADLFSWTPLQEVLDSMPTFQSQA